MYYHKNIQGDLALVANTSMDMFQAELVNTGFKMNDI